MRVTIWNFEMWNNHKAEIEKLLLDGKQVNLVYEKAHKPKTKEQMGFVFGALIGQCVDFFEECGYVTSTEKVKDYFYEKVSKILPEIVEDNFLLPEKTTIKHFGEYDRELMAKFIDCMFEVIAEDPRFAGIQLTPDTFYNFVFHLTHDDIRNVQTMVFDERDENYLEHIREKPCIICGIQHRSEAHHIRDTRTAGMAIKSPDWAAVPLCHKCHMNIAHGEGFKDRMSWLPIDIVDFLRICYLRYCQGIG